MSDVREWERRLAGKRLLGGLLMAGGGMIALLCGLCSVGFGYALVASNFTGRGFDALWGLLFPLITGGVPAGVGVVVFLIGRSIYRNGSAPRG